MKKIAIFSNDLSVGGIQKSLYNLLNNIDLKKYEIDVYLMGKKNFYQDKIPKEIKIYYLKEHHKLFKYLPYKILNKCFQYEGLNKKYDVAIDFDGYQKLTALNALKCSAHKKVMWIHNNVIEKAKYDKKYKIANLLTKDKNKYFDEYVGVSKGVILPFLKSNHLKEIKYHIIPNLIDTEEIFKKAEEECDLVVDPQKYNLCSLGHLNIQKGFDILLKDLKELVLFRQDFHFYLIGSGKEQKKLNKLVNKWHLNEYVSFLGYQKNPYKYLKLMDGFALTSRYEGQGMVLWEAKCLGLELFMSKNLEQYNNDLKGYDDIVEALKKAEKKPKVFDDLRQYNEQIMASLDNLFN